jgi:hypothetical protein
MKEQRDGCRRTAKVVIGLMILLGIVSAQTAPGPTQTGSALAAASTYLNSSHLPSTAKAYLSALGSRLQTPGQERETLVGTYSDSTGSTAAQLVWEAPGNLRFDRTNRPGHPLIYNTTGGLVGPPASAADSNLLESLLDDAAECFLYTFQTKYAHRFLGGLFRTDSGKSGAYQGPWYEVFETTGNVHAQPGSILRTKLYHFDSATKLLVKTVYSTGNTRVTTYFNNWTTAAGQRFPGKIVRSENGTQVASFSISTGGVGPAANDGLFSGKN